MMTGRLGRETDSALAERVRLAPREPGVYIFKDETGRPIYVGKARDLRDRLAQHLRGDSLGGWAAVMRRRAREVEWIVTRSETEALVLEANLIKEHKPVYNIRLADDKSYPYLKITDELFPRLLVIRDLPREARVQLPGERQPSLRRFHDPKRHEVYGFGRGLIFGPYPTAAVMWRLRALASQLFGMRQCRKRIVPGQAQRPCLNYHIKRCVGPCRGEMTPEEYDAQVVTPVVMFLEGRTAEIRTDFERRMKEAAEQLDFERAALYRDKLKVLEAAAEEQAANAPAEREQDVIGVASEDDFAVVELFPVRAGRLLAPEHYRFSHVRGRTLGEIIEAALTLHYSQRTQPPKQILLPEPVPEMKDWQEMLEELRGGRVELLLPQRGEKRHLIMLAQKNAQVRLAELLVERGLRREEHLAALEDLAAALGLPERLQRIECFDISNLQGQEAVGSMIVFTDGLPDKRSYRRFKIRFSGKPDDYAMLAEAVRRRLARARQGDEKFLPLPDLLVVDGGKGQVSTIRKILEEAGLSHIALVGLAKREEEVFVPGQSAPIDMEDHPRGRFLLQRVRDEAHRFAHTYHEGLRRRQLTRSLLDEAPGIGPRRRAALLRAFPSVQAIAEASLEELAAVPGMNRRAAEQLRQYLLAAMKEQAKMTEEVEAECADGA